MNIKIDYQSVALPERYSGLPKIDLEQCISCGLCVAICPNKALERIETAKEYKQRYPYTYPRIDLKKCSFCALCQDICPVGAIQMTQNIFLSATDPSALIALPTSEIME